MAPVKTLNDRVSDGIRDSIGNLTLQLIQAQAAIAELQERLAALERDDARPSLERVS